MTAPMEWSLHPAQAFGSMREAWNALNRGEGGSPLLDADFIEPLLQHLPDGATHLACGRRNGQERAMLLLASRGAGAWQTYQPPQLPVGACVHAADADWPACLAGLMPRLPGIAVALGITQQDPALHARPASTPTLATLDYIRTARIMLSGEFDAYWEARGKNLRQNLNKQQNRLERDGIATRLEIITAAAEVAQAVGDYARLESSGWKGGEGTAVRVDDAQGRFYAAMLERFCARGRGRIYRYWYGDRVAAMDLCIEGDDCLIVLKTAYDETLAGMTSPALLMRREAVAGLFAERRLGRIEFYGRLLEWHRRWTDDVRTMFHVTLYRWTIIPALRTLLRRDSRTADQLPADA